jgi:hypothetical protein
MLPITLRSFPPPPSYSLDLFESLRLVPAVHPLKEDVLGDIGHLLWILMGGIGIVLLIACANVANLLLVRAEGRQQELAVRAALGAGRIRLAGELLFDGIVVGLLGGGIGLLIYVWFLAFTNRPRDGRNHSTSTSHDLKRRSHITQPGIYCAGSCGAQRGNMIKGSDRKHYAQHKRPSPKQRLALWLTGLSR